MALIDDIYQQFKDYFGEERVDLQVYNESNNFEPARYCEPPTNSHIILIHWPEVKVTNEFDDSIVIWGLYGAVFIDPNGCLYSSPQFIRNIYDHVQWNSGYFHSHVSDIGKHEIRKFHTSCLGQGPINTTISRLQRNSEDLDVWKLYCWELDKYVTVESISGGPYKRIANVGNQGNGPADAYCNPKMCVTLPSVAVKYKTVIKQLMRYIIENDILSFSYYNNKYHIASNYVDTTLTISNAFIQLYNNDVSLRTFYSRSTLYRDKFIVIKSYINGMLYAKEDNNAPVEAVVATELFTFKGNIVKLEVKDFNRKYEIGDVHVLHPNIICYMLYLILKYVNVKYGRENNFTNSDKKTRIL